MLSYTTVMPPYLIFCIFDFLLCQRWCPRTLSLHFIFCDVTDDSFGSAEFFVNNFWSHWERESRKELFWWEWAPEQTDIWLFPEVNPWPDGVWPDHDLGVSLDSDLYQTRSISFDAVWCQGYDGALCMALQPLLAVISKKQNPEF